MKIGYARISTRDQSLELQVDALKAAGCEKIYQEVASGAKTARLVLDDLMTNIREGDTLVVWKFDRLARSLRHFMKVIDELGQKKADFVSLTEQIDTTTALGKFIFHMIVLMGELERSIIIERINAGVKAARARGKLGGRPKGLSKSSEEKSQVAKILYLDKNLSIRAIASQLNISIATFYRYLRHQGVEIGSSPIKKVVNCG
jgi:DNA invertase Pin-like site-specific DNA recombinase